MPYNGEIICLSGGMNEYIGELDQGEHPMGKGWYRLRKPCLTFTQKNPQTERIETVIVSLWGDNNAFRKFIDLRIPEDFVIEVKVLDKKGQFYETYKKAINRVAPKRIIMPDSNVVAGPGMN